MAKATDIIDRAIEVSNTWASNFAKKGLPVLDGRCSSCGSDDFTMYEMPHVRQSRITLSDDGDGYDGEWNDDSGSSVGMWSIVGCNECDEAYFVSEESITWV